jgi:hypothetical protein
VAMLQRARLADGHVRTASADLPSNGGHNGASAVTRAELHPDPAGSR